MPDRSMTGVYPILSTPFRKDSTIDYEDLEREVEWFIDSGVHGMASQWPARSTNSPARNATRF